ncbi:hypothetical protein [Actinophytocola oryzae]|uniref:hypothetical protein n=1 Tax=Actinophytocola oryzae TaxID=502181 RepID=UPI0010641E73|nr:hypothetical protein [Actinophytocola oryzae]
MTLAVSATVTVTVRVTMTFAVRGAVARDVQTTMTLDVRATAVFAVGPPPSFGGLFVGGMSFGDASVAVAFACGGSVGVVGDVLVVVFTGVVRGHEPGWSTPTIRAVCTDGSPRRDHGEFMVTVGAVARDRVVRRSVHVRIVAVTTVRVTFGGSRVW